MESFEQRKNQYFNKLKENIEIVEQMTNNDNSDKENNKKTLEMLLMPTTEQELQFDNLMIDFMSDMRSLTDDIVNDNVKDIDLSICEVVKFYAKIIVVLKNEDNTMIEELKNALGDLRNPKAIAKLYYELIVAFGSNPDETVESIMTEAGFDVDDELSLLQFQIYLNKANEITNSKQSEKFDVNNPVQIEFLSEFTKEFNRIYKSGIKKIKVNLKV